MDTLHEIEQRLINLEIKASFNEDQLDQLNQVIIDQQRQIELLLREVGLLRQQMPDGNMTNLSRAGDELPPHY